MKRDGIASRKRCEDASLPQSLRRNLTSDICFAKLLECARVHASLLGSIAEERARLRARRAAVLRYHRRILHRVLDTPGRLQRIP